MLPPGTLERMSWGLRSVNNSRRYVWQRQAAMLAWRLVNRADQRKPRQAADGVGPIDRLNAKSLEVRALCGDAEDLLHKLLCAQPYLDSGAQPLTRSISGLEEQRESL